jgi:hypothetical protein
LISPTRSLSFSDLAAGRDGILAEAAGISRVPRTPGRPPHYELVATRMLIMAADHEGKQNRLDYHELER